MSPWRSLALPILVHHLACFREAEVRLVLEASMYVVLPGTRWLVVAGGVILADDISVSLLSYWINKK